MRRFLTLQMHDTDSYFRIQPLLDKKSAAIFVYSMTMEATHARVQVECNWLMIKLHALVSTN